ncbi:hypothetical protein SSP24_37070 [Streptomyces spinoverrucosus]|uniref:Uncharacterized protein n=1 Tax=Streptomyces spinoverrucosus TaxID=284043 RepID=A0A4Y3VG37_9ACTN|nr:hypothetical protein SSP24_37070 [Streptomyces spinoverrucosus]GHB90178.1 hypothetical protein GCM10010397_73020 [Streptomyces spinoverrucosus]
MRNKSFDAKKDSLSSSVPGLLAERPVSMRFDNSQCRANWAPVDCTMSGRNAIPVMVSRSP